MSLGSFSAPENEQPEHIGAPPYIMERPIGIRLRGSAGCLRAWSFSWMRSFHPPTGGWIDLLKTLPNTFDNEALRGLLTGVSLLQRGGAAQRLRQAGLRQAQPPCGV